jgi:hypothetical protein
MLYFLIALCILYLAIGSFLFLSMTGAHLTHRILFGMFWPVLVLICVVLVVYDLRDPFDDE